MSIGPRGSWRCELVLAAAVAGFAWLGLSLEARGQVTARAPATRPAPAAAAVSEPSFPVDPVRSSWDDLTAGVKTPDQWRVRKEEYRQDFLELVRDAEKPPRVPLDLQVHDETVVEGLYTRKLISYAVEAGERAHAYLAIPLGSPGPLPAIVVLHGTFAQGKDQAAGLVDKPEKAYLDHLARRGYVAIAPDHFVAGHRLPAKGPYETAEFYSRHPKWTAVGKFTYEHSMAVDVLCSLPRVDRRRIGAMGHSLGGQGTFFLAAYDQRIAAAACNCAAASIRQNAKPLEWSRDRWYIYLPPLREDLLAGRLPAIDMHHVIALIAPRPFLDVAALNDGSRDTQAQRVLMNLAIAQVYEIEGAPENFAFFVHGRGHSVPHESRELIYGFLDAHLKPPTATACRLVGSRPAN